MSDMTTEMKKTAIEAQANQFLGSLPEKWQEALRPEVERLLVAAEGDAAFTDVERFLNGKLAEFCAIQGAPKYKVLPGVGVVPDGW
jgi:hypothetical protein